jgi:hypothetical protein
MSGLSCGSSIADTYQGSQWHSGPGWLNDPLSGTVENFMSTVIPAGFNPQDVEFLAAISQLSGLGYNSLAAVPTVPIQTPYCVDILIGGVPQRWFLVAGTSSGGPGIVIPNDYNAVSNTKYWIQLS